MRSVLAISVILLSTMCWVVPASHAQSFTGSIIGTVKNTNGEVVPNAEITITQIQTNKVITVITNSEGYYTSPPLPVGD
jgi:phosphate/sulfate permease